MTAAASLLEDVGPSAVTMRRIAKGADVSLGTVHYYFPDKDSLLDAVFDSIFTDVYRLRDELVRALSVTGSPAELLENAVRVGYRTAIRMRAASRLMQIMALDHGFIPQRRRAEEEVVLAALSSLAERTLLTRPIQARLLIKSMLFCIGRYATLSADELRRVTGLPPTVGDADVHAAIEDHLVELTRVFARA